MVKWFTVLAQEIKMKQCENNSVLKIDWENGDVSYGQCFNESTRVIVDHMGFSWLCEECIEEKLGKMFIDIDYREDEE